MRAFAHNRICRSAFVTLVLALLLAATPALYAGAAEEDASWEQDIHAMLEAPSVSGEAVVILGEGQEDDLLAAQSGAIDTLEPLMEVSADSLDETELPDKRKVTVARVTSSELSTEGLLNALADDPHVIAAEPNYLVEQPEEPQADDELQVAASPEAESEDEPAEAAAGETSGSTVADLAPLQWGNSNNSTVRAVGLEGSANWSANVPNFGGTGSNMERPVTVAVFAPPCTSIVFISLTAFTTQALSPS